MLSGKPVIDALKEEAGELALALIKLTPPKTIEQGMQAVSNDFDILFEAWNYDFLRKYIEDHGGQKTYETLTVFTKSKRKIVTDDITLSPDGTGMAQFHKSNLNKRGRAFQAGQYDKTIGRWRSSHKMWVSYEAFGWYINKIWARIGYMKSGWLAGFFKFKQGDKKAVPQWVRRHALKTGEASEDGLASRFPSVSFTNKTHMIASATSGGERLANLIQSAMKQRSFALATKIRRILKGEAIGGIKKT